MKDLIKNINKKKLLIICGAIIGVVVLIIIALLLYNAFFTKSSYQSVEDKLVVAAKKYYNDNERLLPKSINEEANVNSATLISNGYIKSLEKLVPDKINCTATVSVTNINNNYRYTPQLKCGTTYETKLLSDYIKAVTPTVISGQGLYELNGELVYRGENPNNNVRFANGEWKIVKIEDNHIMLISNEKVLKSNWDNRFNTEKNSPTGINDYSLSRVNDYLTNLYNSDSLFNITEKSLIISHDLAVGKRDKESESNDGSIEKTEIVANKFIGLLPFYDFINASLDEKCNSGITQSCSNYNYLTNTKERYSWWTMTGLSSDTYSVYKIGSTGRIEYSRPSSSAYMRPVIYLTKGAIYVGGNGTIDNPYILK